MFAKQIEFASLLLWMSTLYCAYLHQPTQSHKRYFECKVYLANNMVYKHMYKSLCRKTNAAITVKHKE